MHLRGLVPVGHRQSGIAQVVAGPATRPQHAAAIDPIIARPLQRRVVIAQGALQVAGQREQVGAVPGLYLCGAGTHPGGGVTGAPGHNAAKVILSDL
ncbi:MAG: hypothetical protein EOP92_29460 [Lysobacteraceae bacterium]|nr:MAG: hypothetical protein EOP92_29460 [Xanthomonadaceae bacterium]